MFFVIIFAASNCNFTANKNWMEIMCSVVYSLYVIIHIKLYFFFNIKKSFNEYADKEHYTHFLYLWFFSLWVSFFYQEKAENLEHF
jgi:hypothetical protein